MTKTELMTPEREIQLFRNLKLSAPGSKSYKRQLDELVLANQGLVHKLVSKFPIKNASCTYDDLFQEGIAGLIHAIEKFDTSRGYRLSTYAYRWIQAYISRFYQNHGKTIRIPVHLATKEMTSRKQVEALTVELGHVPSPAEMTEAGITTYDTVTCTSLNKMITDNEEAEALVGDDLTETHDYIMECELLLDKVKSEVSPRDFNIFTHRYGLLGVAEHTLNEIAEYHGITRSRVHQVSNEVFEIMSSFAYSQSA